MSAPREVDSAVGAAIGSGDARRLTVPSLASVCESPASFLAGLDIAALNLMCAGGLAGAEGIDPDRCFDWIDEAARNVDLETRRHWYRFSESPSLYRNSPGYFCCYYLLQVLQEDFGVRYNPARVRDPKFQDPKCFTPDFKDSGDLFIHGIITGPGGTCASMPVMYVAVGRRLGYPLKLVEARGHLFFRWEDPTGARFFAPEVFNIEGAGEGIASYPDDFYRTWPEPWSDQESAIGCYLKSLSPAEELAAFLMTRAECLWDNGRQDEAIQACAWACGLAPSDARYHARRLDISRRQALHGAEIHALIEGAKRRNRELLDRCTSAGSPTALGGFPKHPESCQCAECRRLRQSSKPLHGDHCRCAACNSAREEFTRATTMPGHQPSCECAGCRSVRFSNRGGGTRLPQPFGHSVPATLTF